MNGLFTQNSYQKLYNMPIGTIFLLGHGQKQKEWKLVKKMVLPFNQLRMVLKGGSYNKPVYIWYDEYDDDPFFDFMRVQNE